MAAKLDILVCTTLARLKGVERVLLPPIDGVGYVVSCQGVDEPIASPFSLRPDVRFFTMSGLGLSRNRNAAFFHAEADLLLLCDDDERLCERTVRSVAEDFDNHPEWDIIQYHADGLGKRYPSAYVSSVELAMRATVARAVSFDERFGVGSPYLACGEEEVFVADARRQGFRIGSVEKVICTLDGGSTGSRFLTDTRVQRSKGAVFRLTRGRTYSYYKCTREAMGWALRRGVNPLPLLRNMFWGIRYAGK